MRYRVLLASVMLYLALAGMIMAQEEPIVIAHRGASGYLPEHTLAAKAMAHAMGAHFLEQDIVLTRDDHPIVLHDVHLDTVTDVSEKFPGRARQDGRFYAIDFTLDEIKTLLVEERIDLKTSQPVYPGRFPRVEPGRARQNLFRVPTLAEEIELIQGLNKSTGRNSGIYPEIKSPAWHRKQGKDPSVVVLQVLAKYGYDQPEDPCYVQCFDPDETRRIREALHSRLRLIQLIGENSWDESHADYQAMRTPAGLAEIAQYAQGIGPWLPHVITGLTPQGKAELTGLVADAHAEGLLVHPYTLRVDALPDHAADFDTLLKQCFLEAQVDGLFTDFPDRAVSFLQKRNR